MFFRQMRADKVRTLIDQEEKNKNMRTGTLGRFKMFIWQTCYNR